MATGRVHINITQGKPPRARVWKAKGSSVQVGKDPWRWYCPLPEGVRGFAAGPSATQQEAMAAVHERIRRHWSGPGSGCATISM